jgi:hypothetical protein
MNKTTVSRNSKKTSGDSKQEADVDAFIHKIVLPNLDPASRMKKPDL